MISSASQASEAFEPEQAMSLQDFWRANGGTQDITDPQNKFANFFTGKIDKIKNEYQTYLDNLNLRNESKATQSARAWDEYMSNTAYSRAFNDLEKVGVNPYILLNSGSSPSTAVGSSSKPSYNISKSGMTDSKNSTKGRDAALILLALARIIAAVA